MTAFQRIQKLRKMSADEVRVRVGDRLRRRRERAACRRQRGRSGAQLYPFDRERLLSAMLTLVPGCRRGELDRLSSLQRQAVSESATSVAELVVSGGWRMLGHEVDLSGKIDWHRDPRTGHSFPRVFYADVPRHQDVDDDVDVKYVWELGRHQFLVELARGWLFSGEERFAERARELLLDFIEQNSLYEGVHWTSGLEVAMRSISWIWTLATSVDWSGWRDEDLQRVGASLAEHAEYLARHFSFYSSPYNHLVGEATALYLASLALSEHPRAAVWRSKARCVLNEHGPEQFYDDGFCVEQATGYHSYTLGFLTMAAVAGRNSGEPFGDLEPHIHQAFRAGVALRQPDGRWPAIGDVDSGRSIPVLHADFWQFDSLCHVGTVLFDDPTLKVGEEPGEELYWLLGCEGVERWHALADAPRDRRVHLPEAGYVSATDGRDWLVFDAGPMAAGLFADSTPSTAHGHLDALQVLYGIGGDEVLVDGGMPYYFQNREWVRHFRSAAAHNTLEIEGLPLAREAGRLAWSHVRGRPELVADLGQDTWLAWASFEWHKRALVERHVLCLPGSGLWIADWLELDRERTVRWHWQLAPDVRVEESPAGLAVITPKAKLQFGAAASQACRHGVVEAAADRPAGWVAPGYGTLVPSTTIVVEECVRSVLMLTSFAAKPLCITAARDGIVVASASRNVPARESSWTSGKLQWRGGEVAVSAPRGNRASENIPAGAACV